MYFAPVFVFFAAVVTASYDISFHKHFATEGLAKRAPFYDLSAFGYEGGQLPRAYDLTNMTFTYLPERSWDHFNEIRAGRNNATGEVTQAFRAMRARGVHAKRSSDLVVMSMQGANTVAKDNFYLTAGDHPPCQHGVNAPYVTAFVYYIDNAFVTFWKSDRCNGHKGSFNPVCETQDVDGGQVCALNFQPASFAAFSGCHRQYESDGCESTSP